MFSKTMKNFKKQESLIVIEQVNKNPNDKNMLLLDCGRLHTTERTTAVHLLWQENKTIRYFYPKAGASAITSSNNNNALSGLSR